MDIIANQTISPSSDRVEESTSSSNLITGESPLSDRSRFEIGPKAKPRVLFLIAAVWSLWGGFLDLLSIYIKKNFLYHLPFYHRAPGFAWRIPLASAVVLTLIAAPIVVLLSIRPAVRGRFWTAWWCSSAAVLAALSRLPIHSAAATLLAIGVGYRVGRLFDRSGERFERRMFVAAAIPLVALGAIATSYYVDRGSRRGAIEIGRSTSAIDKRPNVLFIVLDAVRARSLSLYGHERGTTRELDRWARRGVVFDRAFAAAPWTFPSHASMFTGLWPYQFDQEWNHAIEARPKTLAESFSRRGYRTIGFAGNTEFCSRETGLDAGFIEYHDVVESFLGGSFLGGRLDRLARDSSELYRQKMSRFKSVGAHAFVRDLIELVNSSGDPRPFFAFVNFVDAHEPFVVPRDFPSRFGGVPKNDSDASLLMDWWLVDKLALSERQIKLARDAYDDSIAFLDAELGALLDAVERSGKLEDTIVTIVGDHGESMGEHGLFNHGTSLDLQEIHVPLIVIAPGIVPEGKRIAEPVSLRDIPATLVDLSRRGATANQSRENEGRDAAKTEDAAKKEATKNEPAEFPGSSLAPLWEDPPRIPSVSPAFSEVDGPFLFSGQFGRAAELRGTIFSLVEGDEHYLIDDQGNERLFNFRSDPGEDRDLANTSGVHDRLVRFRRVLLAELDRNREIRQGAGEARKKIGESLRGKLPRRETSIGR